MTNTLSFIQALRIGRRIVPDFISGALVKLQTHKNRDVMYDGGRWYRRLEYGEWDGADEDGFDIYEGEWKPLPMDFQPEVGAACVLGAVAVAMGCDLAEMSDSENATFYAHPDFFVDPEDRQDYPEGFIFQSARMAPAKLRRAKYPCVCATTPHPTHPGAGNMIWDESANSIPEIIAHLNDRHDPRRLENVIYGMGAARKIEESDLWPEDRIVTWLRGMGFNGDHKP